MPTKKPQRETTDRVSKIAARILKLLAPLEPSTMLVSRTDNVTVREVMTLAASCLAQDQTPGHRPIKRRAKRKGRK